MSNMRERLSQHLSRLRLRRKKPPHPEQECHIDIPAKDTSACAVQPIPPLTISDSISTTKVEITYDGPASHLPADIILEIFSYLFEGPFPSCSICRKSSLFYWATSCQMLSSAATHALYTNLDLSLTHKVPGEEIDLILSTTGFPGSESWNGVYAGRRERKCPIPHLNPHDPWNVLRDAYQTLKARPDLAAKVRYLKMPHIASCYAVSLDRRDYGGCWRLLETFVGVLGLCKRVEEVEGADELWANTMKMWERDFMGAALMAFRRHAAGILEGHAYWKKWDWGPFLSTVSYKFTHPNGLGPLEPIHPHLNWRNLRHMSTCDEFWSLGPTKLRPIMHTHLPQLTSLAITGTNCIQYLTSTLPRDRYTSLRIHYRGLQNLHHIPWVTMTENLLEYLSPLSPTLRKLDLEGPYYARGNIRASDPTPLPFEHTLATLFTLCPGLEDLRLCLRGRYPKLATSPLHPPTPAPQLRKMELVIPSAFRGGVRRWVGEGAFSGLRVFRWDSALLKVERGMESYDKDFGEWEDRESMLRGMALEDAWMAEACRGAGVQDWKMICECDTFDEERDLGKWDPPIPRENILIKNLGGHGRRPGRSSFFGIFNNYN